MFCTKCGKELADDRAAARSLQTEEEKRLFHRRTHLNSDFLYISCDHVHHPGYSPFMGICTASVRKNCSTWIAFFWISGGLVLTAWALIIVSLVTKNCSAVTIVAIVFASIALLLCLLNCIAYPKIYKTSKRNATSKDTMTI